MSVWRHCLTPVFDMIFFGLRRVTCQNQRKLSNCYCSLLMGHMLLANAQRRNWHASRLYNRKYCLFTVTRHSIQLFFCFCFWTGESVESIDQSFIFKEIESVCCVVVGLRCKMHSPTNFSLAATPNFVWLLGMRNVNRLKFSFDG